MNETTGLALVPIKHHITAYGIGSAGAERTITLSEDECERMAAFLGVERIENCVANFDIKQKGKHMFVLHGHVSANVTQRCVVSLEPVEASISEAIDLELLPEDKVFPVKRDEIETLVISLEDDQPDTYCDDIIDLGAIMVEHLALGVDPYPRAEGAVLEDIADFNPEDRSPFAALIDLKSRMKQG